MRFFTGLTAACVIGLAATAASAQDADAPKIYAYSSHANYCPAGLQPVTIDGTICCGQPNQSISYQQAMAHPVGTRHVRRSARADCPVGAKGCSFD